MTMTDRFLRLSETLTGRSPLDERLAEEYLARVRAAPDGADLEALLDEYDAIVAAGGDLEAAVKHRIMGRDALRKPAKLVILLWYLGEFGEGGPAEHYFQGLFWDVIHAHPPGLSGGYFGHWSYPPDN
jgi:hypothetical protein